ncbi:hypothetical protein QBC42DRAFT_273383 [Cladorrhinum samala]|uniref:Uncharacterized protein n=1 Tax=Cladorrhinum samala TaxID=585594 RepID=A0AAV9HIE0_9PEZI|nr:hypothetical protein QBC42DRAFT_273383 [Cladorrhinum samala]
MSGDDDITDSWEPIPSLSTLSPFSSPALSFLILSASQDLGSSTQHAQPRDSDVDSDEASSHRTPSPRPQAPQAQLNSAPQTAHQSSGRSHQRQSHQRHNQSPSSPLSSTTGVSNLGLGLHQMAHVSAGLTLPPGSPLHHQKTASWASQFYHHNHNTDVPSGDETAVSFNDADDEDEEDETDGYQKAKFNVATQRRLYTDVDDNHEHFKHDNEEEVEEYDGGGGGGGGDDDSNDDDGNNDDNDDDDDDHDSRDEVLAANADLQKHAYTYDYDDHEPPDKLSSTQDDRDVLVERISDLLSRLSSTVTTTEREQEIMTALHSKVDEMELVLQTGMLPEQNRRRVDTLQHLTSADEESRKATPVQQSFESMPDTLSPTTGIGENYRQAMGLSLELNDLPSWLSSPLKLSDIFPESPTPGLTAATNEALEAAKEAAQAQAELSDRVAYEAEQLRSELARVVQNLKIRREESDHLHSLLVERAEAAAGRIIELEKEVSDLEDDLTSSESELRHLRLEMRAIETLVNEFIPREVDPELFQAIQNWKSDWALVRQRMLERRGARRTRPTPKSSRRDPLLLSSPSGLGGSIVTPSSPAPY